MTTMMYALCKIFCKIYVRLSAMRKNPEHRILIRINICRLSDIDLIDLPPNQLMAFDFFIDLILICNLIC